MCESFSNLHDFDMDVIHFPKLTLDQWLDSTF